MFFQKTKPHTNLHKEEVMKTNKARRIATSLVTRHMWEVTRRRDGSAAIPEIYRVFARSKYRDGGSNILFDNACEKDPNFAVGHTPLYTEQNGSVTYTLYTSVGVYKVTISLLHTSSGTDGYDCKPVAVTYRAKADRPWEEVHSSADFNYCGCDSYGVQPQ